MPQPVPVTVVVERLVGNLRPHGAVQWNEAGLKRGGAGAARRGSARELRRSRWGREAVGSGTGRSRRENHAFGGRRGPHDSPVLTIIGAG